MRWLPIVVSALLLAGCMDDDPGEETGPTGDGDPTETGTDGADPTQEPGENTTQDPEPEENETEPRDPVTWSISISGNQFVDGTITVQQGDTVVWTHNDGTVPHTVTSQGSGQLESGTMTSVANNEYPYTFAELGDYDYYCEVHPSMTGTITVLEVYLEEP